MIWSEYVRRFHAESSGITESVLARALDPVGVNPYEWAAAGLARGPVLDVGCGSGPTHALVPGWIGVDRSTAELHAARARGRAPLVAARAEALPVRAASIGCVLSLMSLMVVDDPAAVLAEFARVASPSASVSILVPSDRPLTFRDRARYGSLLVALGRTRMPFPRPDVVHAPRAVIEATGFVVTDDEQRRFGFAITKCADAELLVESLYLPDVAARRLRLARTVARAWGRCEIGIPLRRLRARLAR